jgi:hypothetical protein
VKNRIYITISSVVLVILIIFFSFRNQYLNTTINKKLTDYNKSHSIKIQFEKVCFKGLMSVHFDSLSVSTASGDTVCFIGSLTAGVKIRHLVAGHIAFSKLYIENAYINIRQNTINNYFRKSPEADTIHHSDSSQLNLFDKTDRLLNRVFATIPSRMIIRNSSFIYSNDSIKIEAVADLLQLKNGNINSTIKVSGNHQSQTIVIDGQVSSKTRWFNLSISPLDADKMINSQLANLFGASVNYKSLTINFTEKRKKGEALLLEGECVLGPFEIDYKPLSSKYINFPTYSMKFDLVVGSNYLELDSISEINLGKLTLHPFIKYNLSPSDTVILSLKVPAFTTDDFFNSLPADLFPDLRQLDADGSLSYYTKLFVDLKQPDSLRLESFLKSNNFRIKHIDNELLKMNSDFLYTAYEKGKAMRTFQIGPENPDYRALNEIPILLQNLILCAEDNAFYSHRGFWIESIRSAIVKNIKERKFARGGSTISQQLVKNVYLSREKTISRKLEEIILVWIIESNHLVPKGRMLEVYLNIIEWGPNVYGVNEASHFYFRKDVSQLNPSECIFLASVIPSPKKFFWRFDKEGQLQPFMLEYYRDMSEKMFSRGYLRTSNGDSLSMLLHITGPAKSYLKTETLPNTLLFPFEETEE